VEEATSHGCAIGLHDQESLRTAKWCIAVDVAARVQNLGKTVNAVVKIPSETAQFVPIRFVFTNKVTRDDKLLLAFDAVVLSEILGRQLGIGKLIHGENHATLKVNTAALASEVRKQAKKVTVLLSNPSPPTSC